MVAPSTDRSENEWVVIWSSFMESIMYIYSVFQLYFTRKLFSETHLMMLKRKEDILSPQKEAQTYTVSE